MIQNGIQLCWDLKSHLENDTFLNFERSVVFQIWEESPFPEFDNCCLVVSPDSFQLKNKAFQTMQETASLSIVCIVKNEDQTLSVPQIMAVVYDTWISLWRYFKDNQELDIRYDEMTDPIHIKSRRTGENKDFYLWVKIPVKVKFKSKTFQEII